MDTSAWELLLPEGILENFEIVAAENSADKYVINFAEKQLSPDEFLASDLAQMGFIMKSILMTFRFEEKLVS